MSDADQPATITQECALDLLEPEIQGEILLHANTPSQLHNLIKASPRLYQVFLLNKQAILSTVARRQFHPEILLDALLFAKVAQLELPLSRETALELCDIDLVRLREWRDSLSTISESIALCKLASSVSFFIKDYIRNTLPIMHGLGQNLSHEILPEYPSEYAVQYSELSRVETGRLQRGFCRFEIYRSLFARCSTDFDHKHDCAYHPNLSPAEQASKYLQKFPDYQIVEINCVRDYLSRRLHGICTQVQDEAVRVLPTELFIYDPDSYETESAQWDSEFMLLTYAGKAAQAAHFDHLMSLGLPYVRRIFRSTGEDMRNLFLRNNPPGCVQHKTSGTFISAALEECLGPNPAAVGAPLWQETGPPFEYTTNPNLELDIPNAWRWAHPQSPPRSLHERHEKGMRDWGWVFWDMARLRESGILHWSKKVLGMIRFDEFLFKLTAPSVQERLLNPLGIWYLGCCKENDVEEILEDIEPYP